MLQLEPTLGDILWSNNHGACPWCGFAIGEHARVEHYERHWSRYKLYVTIVDSAQLLPIAKVMGVHSWLH